MENIEEEREEEAEERPKGCRSKSRGVMRDLRRLAALAWLRLARKCQRRAQKGDRENDALLNSARNALDAAITRGKVANAATYSTCRKYFRLPLDDRKLYRFVL